jgi:hypothetical protein
MVPTKIVHVGEHALHRRAEIVADAQPVEALVVAGTDPRIQKPSICPSVPMKSSGVPGSVALRAAARRHFARP